jgi:hypothetical protein
MGAGAGAGQELQSTSTTPKHPCNNKSQMLRNYSEVTRLKEKLARAKDLGNFF